MNVYIDKKARIEIFGEIRAKNKTRNILFSFYFSINFFLLNKKNIKATSILH
jgi:hypothetical protein